MEVYVVQLCIAWEGDYLMGVFSDYAKARQFELDYCAKNDMSEDDCIEIRKIGLDKVYNGFGEIGEVM